MTMEHGFVKNILEKIEGSFLMTDEKVLPARTKFSKENQNHTGNIYCGLISKK